VSSEMGSFLTIDVDRDGNCASISWLVQGFNREGHFFVCWGKRRIRFFGQNLFLCESTLRGRSCCRQKHKSFLAHAGRRVETKVSAQLAFSGGRNIP